jgi:hypothetical protein
VGTGARHKVKLLVAAHPRAGPGPRSPLLPAPMALSKGLRLLARLDPTGPSSVLLEARGRGDCLLFEAGAVATLGECRAPRAPHLGSNAGEGGRAGISEGERLRGDLRTRGARFPDREDPGGLGMARGACPREYWVRGTPESWHIWLD